MISLLLLYQLQLIKENIPNLKSLDSAINDLISFDLKGKFIVIESTVFPTLCSKYIKLIQLKKKNIIR